MAYRLPKNATRRTRRTNKNSGRNKRKLHVTVHWWDEPSRKPTFAGTVNWLARSSVRASVQCVAEAGKITYMEPDDAAAWHSGSNEGNRDSWAIEINPRLSDGDYRTAAEAIAKFWYDHKGGNPTRLIPHRNWTSTNCPGTLDLAKLERYAKAALARETGRKAPKKPKPPKRSKLVVDGRLGTQTVSRLQEVLGVAVDGRAGGQTWSALQRTLSAPYIDGVISRQSYTASELGNGVVPSRWEYTGRGSRGSQTVERLQRHIGVRSDGVWFEATTRALQVALNAGRF